MLNAIVSPPKVVLISLEVIFICILSLPEDVQKFKCGDV